MHDLRRHRTTRRSGHSHRLRTVGGHQHRARALSPHQADGSDATATPDGDVMRLWDFVNVDAEDRPVLLAVLVAALIQCDVPHPVLALFAEQGSTKSTTTRMLVDLIDPSPVPLRQAPRDADSWVTAASGSCVVGLDNVSASPGEMPLRGRRFTDVLRGRSRSWRRRCTLPRMVGGKTMGWRFPH